MKQALSITKNIQGQLKAFQAGEVVSTTWEKIKTVSAIVGNRIYNAMPSFTVTIPVVKTPEVRIPSVVNRYTIIMVVILSLSLMQLNLLGRGLFSAFNQEEQAPVVVTEQKEEVKKFVPQRIQIEKVNIDLPVVSVPLENGTWKVYSKTANFAEGTSLVNEKEGNVGIFGHDRTDAFSNIKKLQSKDEYVIILSSQSYRAIYKVFETSIVAPTDVNVFDQTKEPTLTLITCDGVFSEKRFMVKAKLVKIEKIETTK